MLRVPLVLIALLVLPALVLIKNADNMVLKPPLASVDISGTCIIYARAACICQKLAPDGKNSTDKSAGSADFPITAV